MSHVRLSPRYLLGLILIASFLAGLPALAPGASFPVPTFPIRFSRPVIRDIANDTTDPDDYDDSEPSIAVSPVDPSRIAAVTFSEPWSSTDNAPVWKSDDGGSNWRKVFQIPQPPNNAPGPGDQKVAFDGNGRLHVAELSVDTPPRNFVYRQTGAYDGALTPGAVYGDDQPHLDITRGAGTCAGTLYSPWLNFGVTLPRSVVSSSIDRGVTITDVNGGDNSTYANRTTRIAIAPDGSAYIVYKKRQGLTTGMFEKARFTVNRSDDCGATWNALGAAGVSVHGSTAAETFFTSFWGNSAKGKVGRARSSDAWIAADPGDGDIYVAYVRKDTSGFGQIYVSRSADRGQTWTSGRVSDGAHHSAFPEIAVTDNGSIGVLYVDFDDSGSSTIFRHRFARSFNDGASWSNQTLQSMDPGPLANARSGFLWGDYEGLTAWGNTFYGVFTGQSIGRTPAQMDPIFFSESGVPFAVGPICGRSPSLCSAAVLRPDRIVLKCAVVPCVVLDPLPRNCLVKFSCPGCPPGGLCPPWYNIFLDRLDPAVWQVGLFDGKGNPIPFRQVRAGPSIVLSFRPSTDVFKATEIGNLVLAFRMTRRGRPGIEYSIPTRLTLSDRPFGALRPR